MGDTLGVTVEMEFNDDGPRIFIWPGEDGLAREEAGVVLTLDINLKAGKPAFTKAMEDLAGTVLVPVFINVLVTELGERMAAYIEEAIEAGVNLAEAAPPGDVARVEGIMHERRMKKEGQL